MPKPDLYSHIRKAEGHPYGFAWANSTDPVCFLRISKSGSTYFVKTLNLRGVKKPVRDYRSNYFVFTVLRSPFHRLLSSIPESLKRVRSAPQPGQVPISSEVEDSILDFRGDTFVELALHFLKMIQEIGPFDAHHESQYKFLFDYDGSPYRDCFVFDLQQAGKAVRAIRREARLPRLVARTRIYAHARTRPNVSLNEHLVSFPKNHPLLRMIGHRETNIPNSKVEQFLRESYREMIKSPEIRNLATKITADAYKVDSSLYRALVRKQSKRASAIRLSDL